MGLMLPLLFLLSAFIIAGFIVTTVLGVAVVVGLVVNLALLPLRIFLWVLRAIFGFF
jgi:hypothetical protein